MPNKTKAQYLALPVAANVPQWKVILDDAAANKGVVGVTSLVLGPVVKIVLEGPGGLTHEGQGATRHEAMADAAGKF